MAIIPAKVPIQEFRTLDNKEVIAANMVPFTEYYRSLGYTKLPDVGYGGNRTALFDALRDFEIANKDNKFVQDTFDREWYSQDKDFLYSAYDRAVALSHWNEIPEYVQRLDDVVSNEIKNAKESNATFAPGYDSSMLTLLAECYYAKANGLSSDDINYMIDLTAKKDVGFIEANHMRNMRMDMQSGKSREQIKVLHEEVTHEAKQSVDFWLENHEFNADEVRVIGACKSQGSAYSVYSNLHFRSGAFTTPINFDQAKEIVKNTNKMYDYISEHKSERLSLFSMETYADEMAKFYAEYGDAVTPEKLSDLTDKFLTEGTEKWMSDYIASSGYSFEDDLKSSKSCDIENVRIFSVNTKYGKKMAASIPYGDSPNGKANVFIHRYEKGTSKDGSLKNVVLDATNDGIAKVWYKDKNNKNVYVKESVPVVIAKVQACRDKNYDSRTCSLSEEETQVEASNDVSYE